NDYYDPKLKKARLAEIAKHPKGKNFTFKKLNLTQGTAFTKLAKQFRPQIIIHLAAQAGVRYGLVNQTSYLESNLIGHFHVLQTCKALADAKMPIAHLLYASICSVSAATEKV